MNVKKENSSTSEIFDGLVNLKILSIGLDRYYYPNLSPQDQESCKKNSKFMTYVDSLYAILSVG